MLSVSEMVKFENQHNVVTFVGSFLPEVPLLLHGSLEWYAMVGWSGVPSAAQPSGQAQPWHMPPVQC